MISTSVLRSTRTRVAAGAAAVALVGGGLATTVGGSAAAEGDDWPSGWPTSQTDQARGAAGGAAGETIRLRERLLRDAEVDIDGDGRFDPGDSFIFEARLRDAQTGDRVGRHSVQCQRMVNQFSCEGTFLLDNRGKIMIGGEIFRGEQSLVLAVTGGTGEFREAAGTMSVVSSPAGGDVLVVRLAD